MSRAWMIYGANGYTGELIAREAARRGLAPVLAGRSEQKIAALAQELGLAHRGFDLGQPAAVREGKVGKTVRGPGEADRARTPSFVWGEVRNAAGRIVTGRIKVANGYDVTVHAALGIVARVLEMHRVSGHLTPAQLVGHDFVEQLPGSGPVRIEAPGGG